MPSLNDPSLLRHAALVGRRWIEAGPDAGIAATNPATGAVIGHVPNLGAGETRAAIEAAEARRNFLARCAVLSLRARPGPRRRLAG